MMDATQRVCDSFVESDEEEHEEEKDDRGDPLGKLCILKNEHIPENECLLFLGDNVLGRDPNTCSLPLLAPSVSKQHATISLSMYRRKGKKDEVEALLWDLGSMNGTRKGHLKLTPNVRYALSEGDSLTVADIPCKYIKYSEEVDSRTAAMNKQNSKLSENASNINKTKSPASSTKTKDPFAESGVTQGTPARTGGLTLEQTPTQEQHGSLVPDSESESEEEKCRNGNRRRKAIVSDSDSKSSPACSTFLSPSNKIIPESEDESPITPSSSHKNRTRRVSFNTESDADVHRHKREKAAELEIVDDSEEETENDEAALDKNSSAAKMESTCSTEDKAVSQFNLESDTDVEEEEENPTKTPPVLSINATETPNFHVDSDTDVEDDEGKQPPALSKNSQVVPIVQLEGINMDSDTDVEEEGEKPNISPIRSNNNIAQASKTHEFHLDSDTDVEDEDLLSAVMEKPMGQEERADSAVAKEPANPNELNLESDTDVEEGEADLGDDLDKTDIGEPPSRLEPVVSKPAVPLDVHFDIDMDDDEILDAAVESEKPDLEILSNSDTEEEDDSPEIQPSTSKTDATEGRKLILGQNPAGVTMEDEEEEHEIKDKEDNKMPVLQREMTPGIQGALQMCSTPVLKSEGNIEEMETQLFLSPSQASYGRAAAARKPAMFSPGSDSQEEDFVVAETQSFILNDRGQDPPSEENPNISSDLDSAAEEKDVSSTSRGHLQLELSDSSTLQAQALALESTQAYVTMSLEETQAYADAFTSGAMEGSLDIALQETQPYLQQVCSEEDSGEDQSGEDQKTEKADQEDVQSVPQSSHERGSEEEQEEATQAFDFISEAPTQLMCLDEQTNSMGSTPHFSKIKQHEEEEIQQLTHVTEAETPMEIMEENADKEDPNSDLTVAQTQPMSIMEDSEGEEDSPVLITKKPKRIEEEATQAYSDQTVAQTQPIDNMEDSSSEEDSPVHRKRKAKCLEPVEDTEPSEVPPTQPLPATETEESGGEGSSKVVRKRQTRGRKSAVIVDPELPVAPTQPLVLQEEVESDDDEEAFPSPRRRKARKLEDTQSLTNSQEDTKEVKEESGQGEGSSVSVKPRRAGMRSGKEKQETAEEVSPGPQRRQTRGKGKAAAGSRGRVKVMQDTEDAQKEKMELEKRERERVEKENKEKEEKERLEKEKVEKELKAKQQKQKEEKERMAQEKREREEKERREKEEKARIEQEKKDLAAKRKQENEEKKQKELLEKREREEKKRKEKEERERLEAAKKAEEEAQRREQERIEMEEKERLEREKQELNKTKEETPRRGRRTTAASRTTAAADEDGPATRTRSRSNSSNSVSSERSASSIGSQTNRGRGRGRGRGTRKTEEVRVEKTPGRGRRRTVAAVEVSAPETLPRSDSSRGRGRRPKSEAVMEQVTRQTESQRGRRSTRLCSVEEMGERAEPCSSTRGQGGARDQAKESSPEKDGNESSQKGASAVRRGGRRTLAKTESEAKAQGENEVDSTATRSNGARVTREKKSVKAEAAEEEDAAAPSEKPKVRGRASVMQRKKSPDQGDSGSSGGSSMEQDVNPKEQETLTPKSSVSRKRQSTDPESDPVAKTPRSCTASPGTAARAQSQAYKVLFTGMVDEAGEKVLTRLRGRMAKDVSDMNCLVTDKVRRTVKFLCAVAKGIPIVTTQWLEKSGKAGTFLSPNAFLVNDREQENKFGFKLKDSLRAAKEQPLLQGYEIHVTKSVQPEPVHMKDIIVSSGGVFLSRMPSSSKPRTVVISCEDDWSLCSPALSCSVPVVSAEFILTGILQQKVDLDTHKLSGPAPAPGGRGKSRKKS